MKKSSIPKSQRYFKYLQAHNKPSTSQNVLRLAQLAIQGDYTKVLGLATPELVQAKDDLGRTALILCAEADWTPQPFGKCIELLLHLGANPAAADSDGSTAAHVAASRNHLRLLALLPFEAKFLAKKLSGDTPLMEAVRRGSWQCAKHLLHLFRQRCHYRCKLELLGIRNRQGQTALDIAIATGQTDLAKVIELEQRLIITGDLDTGARLLSLSGLTDSEMKTREELEQLARDGDFEGLSVQATQLSCDLPDADGRTPLMWAASTRIVAWMTQYDAAVDLLLLSLRADATCADLWGRSCLFWAVSNGRAGAVRELLKHGAPVNSRDGLDGRTPLMRAAAWAPLSGAAATGGALLTAGADWSLKDSVGRTAMELAARSSRSRLAELMDGLSEKSFFLEPLDVAEEDQKELQRRKDHELAKRRRDLTTRV